MATVHSPAPPPASPGSDVPFGVNEVRLNGRQWLVAVAILALAALLTPPLWERFERFDTGPDYRVPYALSKDYWLYGRWLSRVSTPGRVFVVGDSVVWGEYVLPDGTLPHFLNRESGRPDRFVNAGVNGLFPLALEGMIRWHGQPLHDRKVLLHCNLLWMTSPKADLSSAKEETFNHARLVPQFRPRVPCYRADAVERVSAVVERYSGILAWVNHLQCAYFGEKSIPKWTLEETDGSPPRRPNRAKNPLAQIGFRVPEAPVEDPQRGPRSPRHKPWSTQAQGATQFEWVPLADSLQWRAFQRTIEMLRSRGNDVLVVVGPFNEHLMAEENRVPYRRLREGVLAWLAENRVPHLAPALLPSALYADASHPLTEGYALLAQRIQADPAFQAWLAQQ